MCYNISIFSKEEVLELRFNSKIEERLDFLTRIADMGAKKEVRGFKRYDD